MWWIVERLHRLFGTGLSATFADVHRPNHFGFREIYKFSAVRRRFSMRLFLFELYIVPRWTSIQNRGHSSKNSGFKMKNFSKTLPLNIFAIANLLRMNFRAARGKNRSNKFEGRRINKIFLSAKSAELQDFLKFRVFIMYYENPLQIEFNGLFDKFWNALGHCKFQAAWKFRMNSEIKLLFFMTLRD